MGSFLAGLATAAALALPLVLVLRRRWRRSEQAQSQTRQADLPPELGSLARGLAHEIRNPLSTMRVNLQLMREDWAITETPREERTARKVEVLQQEVQRLEDTLNDFLRYARGHQLHLERVNINEVVADLTAFVEPQVHQHRISLHRHLADDLPDCLMDVDLIKQAVLNIIINAQQAMPDGGELIVTTRRRRDRVVLDIIDTGAGIDPVVRDQIFDAYFSAKRTGTGLGLALAKRIIEEHDGRIEVESELGKGSQFRIILPAAPVEQSED